MQTSGSNEDVGVLIAVARRRLKQTVAARLVKHGLGPQQFWLLLQLNREEGLSLHELAQRTWTDDPTACRMVSRLVDRGLVRSDEDPKDRRRFRLTLTPKGSKLAGQLESLASEVKTGMVRGLSGNERKQLCGLLERVIANTERLDEEVTPARKRTASRPARAASPARRSGAGRASAAFARRAKRA